ncbi:MAG: hypothetical protein C4521_00660 [Actinobacteria bacterium]|nr:MAG: hypothetical protein C4521_00660 [Actinomycetota bacterium]
MEALSERRYNGERRRRLFALRLHERRSGYDRRLREGPVVQHLRSEPARLLLLLAAVNVMNALDLLLTHRALDAGLREANPVIGLILDSNYAAGILFKLGLVGAATLTVWMLRRYRAALVAAILGVTMYGLLIVYHLFLAATLLVLGAVP